MIVEINCFHLRYWGKILKLTIFAMFLVSDYLIEVYDILIPRNFHFSDGEGDGANTATDVDED